MASKRIGATLFSVEARACVRRGALMLVLLYLSGCAALSGAVETLKTFMTGLDSPEAARQLVSGVLHQNGGGLPVTWGVFQGKPLPAWYGMSTRDAEEPSQLIAISNALRALPSLSIMTASENLFSSTRGIYLHPPERGANWQRPARVEFLDPSRKRHFEMQCGLRIHGGMSRRPEESPKHSFRLVFDTKKGTGRLRTDLFDTPGTKEFGTLVLRAGGNDSWVASNGQERQQAVYLRDEWMRRTMAAMGYSAARGMFVHVYLNDLYWGIYNLCEDAGAAPSGADFDFIKEGTVQSGDRAVFGRLMSLADSNPAEQEVFGEISRLLDVQEFADYMILNIYAGNADWTRDANWYALRPRRPGGRFQFFVWDAEHTLGDIDADAVSRDSEESPIHLLHRLSLNQEFRAMFAARVQWLFSSNGPLAPANCASRFSALADSLKQAMPAEAARWGSYRLHAHSYKSGPYEAYEVPTHWVPAVKRILESFFQQRQRIVLGQLGSQGLLPSPAE